MLSSPITPTRQRRGRKSEPGSGASGSGRREEQQGGSLWTPEKRSAPSSPELPSAADEGRWKYRSPPAALLGSPASTEASPGGQGGDGEVGERSMTAFPGHPRLSITPRRVLRTRLSTSVTPLAGKLSNTSIGEPDEEDSDEGIPIHDMEQDWGEDAVMHWDDTASQDIDIGGDSASSVGPGDAGLATSDDDDEEDWGRDAVLGFDWDASESREATEAEESSSEEEEPIEDDTPLQSIPPPSAKGKSAMESYAELRGRGMPDYEGWELKKLQKLCSGYGYRPSSSHLALVKIASECWRALNPPPPATLPLCAVSSSSSISSADIPLAKTKGKGRKPKTTPTEKVKPAKPEKNSKGGKGAREEEEMEPLGELKERFTAMIENDRDLYLRILRYEPISIDELISKALAAGIKEVGWKDKLKRFLDDQGITFFSADLTGQRRRR